MEWDKYCKGKKHVPSRPIIRNQFGPWNTVLKKAELAIIKKGRKRKYSNSEIIKVLQTYAKIIGHRPTKIEWDKYSKGKKDIPSASTIINRFGSWNGALLKEAKLLIIKMGRKKGKENNKYRGRFIIKK